MCEGTQQGKWDEFSGLLATLTEMMSGVYIASTIVFHTCLFFVVAVLRLWHEGGGYWSVVKISVVRLSEIFKSRLVCSSVLQLNDNSFNISNILTSSDNGPILCAPYRKRRHIFEGLLLRFWRKTQLFAIFTAKWLFRQKFKRILLLRDFQRVKRLSEMTRQ